MTVAAIKTSESIIRWRYLPWALLAIAVMVAAIAADNLWFLDYVHVFSSLLWTGIDLFMGFVLGPILRRIDLPLRRDIMRRLTPRTLFLMPTVSIISGTSGWFLAVKLGYTALDWPAYGWIVAALVLVTLMTISGARLFDARQCICLHGIAEGQSGYDKGRCLDAAIFLRCRHARHNAGSYYCCYDPSSNGDLN